MQLLSGTRSLAEAPRRLRAQLTQPRSSALGPILVRGEIRQVLADQSVNTGVALGGVAANNRQDIFVYAEGDILHNHNICVTV